MWNCKHTSINIHVHVHKRYPGRWTEGGRRWGHPWDRYYNDTLFKCTTWRRVGSTGGLEGLHTPRAWWQVHQGEGVRTHPHRHVHRRSPTANLVSTSYQWSSSRLAPSSPGPCRYATGPQSAVSESRQTTKRRMGHDMYHHRRPMSTRCVCAWCTYTCTQELRTCTTSSSSNGWLTPTRCPS